MSNLKNITYNNIKKEDFENPAKHASAAQCALRYLTSVLTKTNNGDYDQNEIEQELQRWQQYQPIENPTTKEEIISNHRKLWTFIAEETRRRKQAIDKSTYGYEINNCIFHIEEMCWLCGYRDETCSTCLLKWGTTNEDTCTLMKEDMMPGLFMQWCDAQICNNTKKAAYLAQKIADLPEK